MRNLLCALALVSFFPAAFAASAADNAFESAAKAFIEDYLRLDPEEATELGDHRYDDTLRDYSAEGVATRIATWRKHLAALDRINAAQLTGPNRIDAQIMRTNLEAMLFELTEIKSRE